MSSKEAINKAKKLSLRRSSTLVNDSSLLKQLIPKKESSKFHDYNKGIVSNFAENIEDNEDNENISDLSQDIVFNENREKQLKILIEKYTKLYNSKENIYANIIKEIDIEKHLFYNGSIKSFKLLILKIKCLMKILKEKFESYLNLKDERNNYEVESFIQKLKAEFKSIYNMINEESRYEYEIITQVYCKFLYILAIINNHKEEALRCFSYISLGINMLKIFFIRENIATDIETYKIYAKLVILLINKLLADNNISLALIYINLLSRICEIALNMIYKNKLDKKYEYKFNKLNAYNCLFLGYCYELKNNIQNNTNKICLKAYAEAYYLMSKSNRNSIFSEGNEILTIEKKSFYLSHLLYVKLKDKIILETLEKQREYQQQELMKKKLLEEAKTREKKYRLKLISGGIAPEPENIVKIQNKIYNEILNPKNQKIIDKLDDEMISYVYKSKTEQNSADKKDVVKIKIKKGGKMGKLEKLPSLEIMKNLCHFKIYNSLMTNDFKEFLLTNKKLKFNAPQKQKTSLEKIQKFLNRRMEIESNKDKEKETEKNSHIRIKTETTISSENNIKKKILNLKKNNYNKKYKFIEIQNNQRESKSINQVKLEKRHLLKENRPVTSNNKHSFIISKDKDNINMNNRTLNTYSNYTTSAATKRGISNKRKYQEKIISKSMFNTGHRGLEKIALDKYIFNNKYFREYVYFEKLTDKELDFQKQFLESKNNNAKMFFKGFSNELQNNGTISRDDIYNSFLYLNNNAVSKIRNFDKEMKNEIELKNKPKIIGNVFKSVSNKMKEGKEIKNAMMKVLDRYIKKKKKIHTHRTIINREEIKKKNEKSLMKLNDSINEINFLLESKNNEAKGKNKFIII